MKMILGGAMISPEVSKHLHKVQFGGAMISPAVSKHIQTAVVCAGSTAQVATKEVAPAPATQAVDLRK